MRRRSLLAGMVASIVTIPRLAFGHAGDGLTLTEEDRDVLIRTLWCETRGQVQRGQIAVAHVVFNRISSHDNQFSTDRTIEGTCRRSGQFTCWRRPLRLQRLKRGSPEYLYFSALVTYALWTYRRGSDASHGATYFVKRSHHMPAWTHEMRVTVEIGAHVFMQSRD